MVQQRKVGPYRTPDKPPGHPKPRRVPLRPWHVLILGVCGYVAWECTRADLWYSPLLVILYVLGVIIGFLLFLFLWVSFCKGSWPWEDWT